MMSFAELPPVPSDHLVPFTDQLRLAVPAYLARFKPSTVSRPFSGHGRVLPDLRRRHRHPNYILAACMASGT